MKNFYAANKTIPKVHINNTNMPPHLEQMLQLLIDEETTGVVGNKILTEEPPPPEAPPTTTDIKSDSIAPAPTNECFQFLLDNRPLDLLADICTTDSPPGASICILNWMRRFLSCLQRPQLERKSIYEPILKLVAYTNDSAGKASPYEQQEIMFLLTVAGVVRKDPVLLNLFLPLHVNGIAEAEIVERPKKNLLFDAVLDPSVEAVALTKAPEVDDIIARALNTLKVQEEAQEVQPDLNSLCECRPGDSLILFDTILRYFDSAVSRYAPFSHTCSRFKVENTKS